MRYRDVSWTYWTRELIVRLAFLGLGWLLAQVFPLQAAHGAQIPNKVFPVPEVVPHTWIQRNPDYKMKLPTSSTHCCNYDHCLALNPGQVIRVEDGYLIFPSPPFIREVQFFPESEVYYTEPEGEGQFFACAMQGKVRCLFVPSLGM
jgi:hypothetical protein